MEFERSLYRIHERMLQGSGTKKCLNVHLGVLAVFFVYAVLNFLTYHKLYVNKSDILKHAFEN